MQITDHVHALLSSRDEPCRGGGIAGRLQAALDAVQRTHDAVRQALAEEGAQDPARLVPAVVRRLGLPPFAVNPLTARTVAAHIAVASEPRVV